MSSKLAKSKEQYHHGDLRQAMIKQGIQVLRKHGLQALTLKKISDDLGVSQGAPYRHFKDKNTFIAAISQQGFLRLRQYYDKAFQESQTLSAREQYRYVCLSFLRFAKNNPEYYRIMFTNALPQSHQYKFLLSDGVQTFSRLVELVSYLQDNQIVRPGDPLPLAVQLWAAWHGFTSLLIDDRLQFLDKVNSAHDFDAETSFANYCENVLNGLGP